MFGFLGDYDSVKEAAEANKTGKEEDEPRPEPLTAALPGLGGLWSVAKAVQSAVQQTADEVVRSVQTTDWKSELSAFTHEVEAEAQRAVEVVQHLPEKLQHPRGSSESGSPRAGDAAAGSSSGNGGGGGSGSAGHRAYGGVGSSLAEFGKQLISGTKEVLETVTDMVEGELATASREVPRFAAGGPGSRSGARTDSAPRLAGGGSLRPAARYSRFDAEVAAMQRDSATYCDEPEDAADFAAWCGASFSLAAAQPEIDKLLAGNAFMGELQSRLVPLLVEADEFWARYFYRLHKLQQREDQRQQLAARAKQLEDAEELGGWDDDEEEQELPRAATQQRQQDQDQAPEQAQEQQHEGQQEQQREQQQQQQPHDQGVGLGMRQQGQGQSGEQEQEPKRTAGAGAGAGAAATDGPPEPEQGRDAAAGAASVPADSSSSGVLEAAGAAPAAQQADAPSPPGQACTTAPTAPAAAATAAAAAAAAALHRKVSEDNSFPSTPVQLGSDASDAALATDTISDSSTATGGRGSGSAAATAAPWTAVGGVPAASSPTATQPQQQQPQQQQDKPASADDGSRQGASPVQQPGAATATTTAAAAAASVAGKPGASPVKPTAAAAAADDDDDDDWGEDADEAATAPAAAAARRATAAAAASGSGRGAVGAAAAGEGEDDDWGTWE